jgi:hypothetical protein
MTCQMSDTINLCGWSAPQIEPDIIVRNGSFGGAEAMDVMSHLPAGLEHNY